MSGCALIGNDVPKAGHSIGAPLVVLVHQGGL